MPASDKALTMHLDPRQMWLPMTAVVVVIGATLTGVWAAAGWKGSLDKNTAAVEKLEKKMDAVLEQSTGFRLWIAALAANNPAIKVPEIPR